MGGLLVHFGAGPVQIEMHFYFFALIAMLTVFGNPLVVVVAAVTVAVHHLALWIVLPASVFNYDAPLWVVLVHAGFVVLESTASVFIARSFFDNVIGLEKIVASRTDELRAKNAEMELVLENIDQGLAICDANLNLGTERSKTLSRWLPRTAAFVDAVNDVDPAFGSALQLGWEQVREGFLPMEVALEQLPRELRLSDGAIVATRFVPIGEGGARFLLVMSDETVQRQQALAEAASRDQRSAMEHATRDPAGFAEFAHDADAIVNHMTAADQPFAVEQRLLHTLKGNVGFFGLSGLAAVCAALEDHIAESGEPLPAAQRAELAQRWESLRDFVAPLLRANDGRYASADVEKLVVGVLAGADTATLRARAEALSREAVGQRLDRLAGQARQLAQRLGRGAIDIVVDDGGVRLDRDRYNELWGTFAHLIRNAVDHGLEPAEERAERGAVGPPTLTLRARERDGVVIEVGDNGVGIDWARVESRAKSRGLAHASHADLKDALFSDGFTTRDAVSDISGRGVGLAAVRAAARALGGDVDVDSTSAGTTFRVWIPTARDHDMEREHACV